MTIAALEQAITFLSRTDLIATARQQSLPPGITDLLKISSGDKDTLLAAQESSRRSQEDVRHAAEFYVQQILFAPDSDHYRVLGVDPDDSEAKIKLHYRLLVRWLHPDRNASDWEAVFSERINRAWHALRTPERRREYDQQLVGQQQSQAMQVVVSREVKPAQWRESESDARFMSARTIQRLPLAVFSVLCVGALLVLFLFSQTQPKLQPSVQHQVMAEAPRSAEMSPEPIETLVAEVLLPMPAAEEMATAGDQENGFIASTEPPGKAASPELTANPIATVIAKPSAADGVKTTAATVPAPIAKTQKSSGNSAASSTPNVVATSETANPPKNKRSRKNALAAASTEMPRMQDASAPALVPLVAEKKETPTDAPSDAAVKQFLQKFSRVYEDGDYFALHNLFTRDLSILGAPAQRSVLRSYRRLFENSQRREISLDHVTWLTSDQNIVVIASYQADVVPLGKAEMQTSRGDIRLDLRVENGQLRIIRLQSDTKNG